MKHNPTKRAIRDMEHQYLFPLPKKPSPTLDAIIVWFVTMWTVVIGLLMWLVFRG